ncbi:MAG: hypothetical protein JGK30_07740 [Microcoleus sp. PH2017_40_RAT_O_B]|nr:MULTISPECIES: hypothetical protein [unclassified Microcoleus]MCC3572192.1 hypothetical protein [Microcoleus sp. PH2017_34_RAT_O_A]MCC3609393.1 hypothetical protein [Microcoleus sp. PH2017_40_RAT_O_B]
MTGINLSSLPASLFFRRWLANVVDYSDCVVALWWLELLMVVDVVDVVGF